MIKHLLIFTILCFLATAINAKELSIQERLAAVEKKFNTQSNNQTNSADIVVQNQILQQQIAELKGIIEEQNHKIKSLKEKQKLLYIDIDSRLVELESKSSGTNNFKTGQINPATQNQVVEVDESYNTSTTSTTSMPSQPQLSTDQDDYDIAFAHLRAGRFLESARAFEDFIQKHPNNELTDNAYYWLGESYYVKRQYPQALAAFQSLTDKFPDSKKAPDSWLKIGYSYYEMDDLQKAEENLSKVINDYPNSSISRLAKNRLNKLQRDH